MGDTRWGGSGSAVAEVALGEAHPLRIRGPSAKGQDGENAAGGCVEPMSHPVAREDAPDGIGRLPGQAAGAAKGDRDIVDGLEAAVADTGFREAGEAVGLCPEMAIDILAAGSAARACGDRRGWSVRPECGSPLSPAPVGWPVDFRPRSWAMPLVRDGFRFHSGQEVAGAPVEPIARAGRLRTDPDSFQRRLPRRREANG